MCWCLVHLSITRGCWSWKILFFPWEPPFHFVVLDSSFRWSTSFHSVVMFVRFSNTRQVSTAGPAVVQQRSQELLNTSRLKPEALFLARWIVVNSMFFFWNVNDAAFFSCLDDPVRPTRLQCWGGWFSLCRRVSSSVFDLCLSTHYLAAAFLFFCFLGPSYCFELVPLHPHTSVGPLVQQVSRSLFFSALF